LADLDDKKKQLRDTTDALDTERSDHDHTKTVLSRVQKELETEMAALAEARTKIIKVKHSSYS